MFSLSAVSKVRKQKVYSTFVGCQLKLYPRNYIKKFTTFFVI